MGYSYIQKVSPAFNFDVAYPAGNVTTAGAAPTRPSSLTGPFNTDIAQELLPGYVEFGGLSGGYANEAALIVPFGVGAGATLFVMNVYAVSKTAGLKGGPPVWSYLPLGTFTTITLDSTLTVPAFSELGALGSGNLFANAITQVKGLTGVNDISLNSPATAGLTAFIKIRTHGCQYLFIDIALGSTTPATSGNALVRKVSW